MISTVLENLFSINGLLMSLLGVSLGIIIGALPGLSAAMGIALMLPVTYTMETTSAFIVLCGLYVGAIYGGSITAILLRTPGTPASAATVIDGYEFTKRGEAGRALGISTVSSGVGGMISAVVLALCAPLLIQFSLSFTPIEKSALAFFGLSIISSVSEKSPLKGILAGLLGMLLSLVGVDPVNGQLRFTMGIHTLYGGFALVPAMVGLLAMSQAYMSIEHLSEEQIIQKTVKRSFPSWSDLKKTTPIMFVSSVIGTLVGIIPGTGGDIASYLAYNEAKRFSKNKEAFGTGIPEGVAAPEAANNGVTGGAMIPMMTLGIPGDAATAVMLGALMLHGLQPGAVFFRTHSDVVYTIFGAMFLGNILMILLGLLCVRWFIKAVSVKRYILTPVIMIFCVIGSFCLNNNIGDVWVMLIFGFVGYILEKLQFPMSPVVLGIILGKTFETQLRQGMVMFFGDMSVYLTRPISLVFVVIGFLSLVMGFVRAYRVNRKKKVS